MSVTASFEPGRISSEPGGTAALTLRLHNDAETDEVVRLRPSGELAEHTVLQSETVYLDPNETFEVPVIVDVGLAIPAGAHSSTIEVFEGGGDTSVAEATIDVSATTGYVASMTPELSRSSAAGRHKITVQNTGNTSLDVHLTPERTDEQAADDVVIELATPTVNVFPGDEAVIEARLVPAHRFWNGPVQRYEFLVNVTSADGTTEALQGAYEQGPRLRPWFLPAAVGAGVALLLGTLAWFLLLRPEVEEIAEEAAIEAILLDRAALQERIDELEQAAAEAEELPLGQPADLRLAASAAPGSSAGESFAVSSDRVLSVTDVVFQNSGGAAGLVSLLRDGEVLLESEMANFRDLDLHFIAPLQFEGGSTIELRVQCSAPGPNATNCDVAATIIGFVDQTD